MSARRFGSLFDKWKILRGDKVCPAPAAASSAGVQRLPAGCRSRCAAVAPPAAADDATRVVWQVKITAGKDKGQTGTIARVLRDQNRVIVEGLNLVRSIRQRLPARLLMLALAPRKRLQVKKHIKRTKEQDGGIVTIEAPLHVSNVQVVDPVTGCARASAHHAGATG
jgi:ribosomal protein L24